MIRNHGIVKLIASEGKVKCEIRLSPQIVSRINEPSLFADQEYFIRYVSERLREAVARTVGATTLRLVEEVAASKQVFIAGVDVTVEIVKDTPNPCAPVTTEGQSQHG